MSDSIIGKIAKHIKKNEKPVRHPYLDTNGHLTIGAGFKVDNENAFTALDLQAKNGRPATIDEKKQAFRQMQAEKESSNGNFGATADVYVDSTSIRMSDGAIERKLKQDLPAWIERTKAEVGGKAWDRLTDEQKTALIDVAYANGSLAKFPRLKEAARNGDAAAMANESHFFSGRDKNGKLNRNWGRIKANHCALSGLDQSGDACKRSVREHYKGTDETPRLPGDGALSNLADSGAGPKNAPTLDNVLARPEETWSEGDVNMVHTQAARLGPSNPKGKVLYERVRAWHDHFYGNVPVKYDATGRMIDPSPVHKIPKGGGGAVHVRAYARDGGKTSVNAYNRSRPGG